MSYHHLAGPDDAHVIYSWAYLTIADRDAHTPVEGSTDPITEDDVLKHRVCYVQSPSSFYFLSGFSPIVWESLGVGSLTNHADRHATGGADEIDVDGLAGVLSEDQIPQVHDLSGDRHSGLLSDDHIANPCIQSGLGQIWEQKSVGCNDGLFYGITYGNGMFVATSGIDTYTSQDGINWIKHVGSGSWPTPSWPAVVFANGMFVSGSNSVGSPLKYSYDGINWTLSPWTGFPGGGSINSNGICWGNGRWVAVSSSGEVAVSFDGVNWDYYDTGYNTQSWIAVCYGHGLFVAVSYDWDADYRIMTSPDGIVWTLRSAPLVAGYHYDICYGNGRFVATGVGPTIPDPGYVGLTSVDGIIWEEIYGPTASRWTGVCYGAGMFVAVAQPIGTHDPVTQSIMVSRDGINWELRSHLGILEWNHWQKICYANGMFVVVCYDKTNRVMTSGRTIELEKSVPYAHSLSGARHAGALPESSLVFGDTGHDHTGGIKGKNIPFSAISGLPSSFVKLEQIVYNNSTDKVIGPLATAPSSSQVALIPIGGVVQDLGLDFTARQVSGGTNPGWYICIDPLSTPPGGGTFSGGSNPTTGISGVLSLGDIVQLIYSTYPPP